MIPLYIATEHYSFQTMIKCSLCNYFSDRKFNLHRHIRNKHPTNNINIENVKNGENVISQCENVISSCENVIPSLFNCSKCNKQYTSKRYLSEHEKKCTKVDSLTCPRCMISFSNRHNKNRHIKADKCNARSIIHARTPYVQNITGNNNVTTIQNAETIQNISNTNNNIIINNFGSERIDHITDEDLKMILQSGINTVPLYIEKKHFDKNFPENKNIKFTDDNKCKVMVDNLWEEKDLGLLSTNLIKDNSEVLLLYCDNNDIKLSDDINDTDKFDHIRNKLIVIYNKSDNQKYNQILAKIKDLIKRS